MKKVNLKRVLGFTNSSPPGPAGSCSVPGGGSASTGGGKELDFGENLSAEQFQTCKVTWSQQHVTWKSYCTSLN